MYTGSTPAAGPERTAVPGASTGVHTPHAVAVSDSVPGCPRDTAKADHPNRRSPARACRPVRQQASRVFVGSAGSARARASLGLIVGGTCQPRPVGSTSSPRGAGMSKLVQAGGRSGAMRAQSLHHGRGVPRAPPITSSNGSGFMEPRGGVTRDHTGEEPLRRWTRRSRARGFNSPRLRMPDAASRMKCWSEP